MEFRLLGPVEALVGDQPIGIGHAKQRAVLAVLLLDVGHVVSAELLIDRVWGDDPPPSARNLLSGYIARLREALAQGGEPSSVARADKPGVSLARHAGGYVLTASADQVDLYRFRSLVTKSAAAGTDERAEFLLQDALDLWRGDALAGLASPWLASMRETVNRERLTAVLDLNDLKMRQGKHASLLTGLEELAARYPVSERITGQLMVVLFRLGQQAEALRRFADARQRLAEELGVRPGVELQTLHERILRRDESLALPHVKKVATAVLSQLPRDVPAFIGRSAEFAELDRLASPATRTERTSPHTVVISAVSGTAGVGKTALAIRWARQAAAQFPAGIIYVNLRGYDPDEPVAPGDALAGFLRSLGVAGSEIPTDTDERATMYRSLLAGKRMLVVLDNAIEAEQVRPLLPSAPGCMALVTSRNTLAGLVARDGAIRLDLDLLPLADAIDLLRTLIGARADEDPDAAADLAVLCSRLPLALRVAAERVAARPQLTLADHVAELADQRQRLNLLDAAGDRRTAVRAVFSWSIRQLHEGAARTFRLAGLHPLPDFDAYAAAALAGTTLAATSQALGDLVRVHLVQPTDASRYLMHDLLRSYAREQVAANDTDEDQRQALTRLFDHYLFSASAAMDTLFPSERNIRPTVNHPQTASPSLADAGAARAWLDTHLPSLVAASGHATGNGWPDHAISLTATLFRYLDVGAHYAEAETLFNHAKNAAAQTGDLAAQAQALSMLGLVDLRRGNNRQALGHLSEALLLYQRAGDQPGEARVQNNLGLVSLQQGRYQQAASHLQQAQAYFRAVSETASQARAANNLGGIRLLQGRYQQATKHFDEALALYRQAGNQGGASRALCGLGEAYGRQGLLDQGNACLQEALALSKQAGDRPAEAYALANLGLCDLRRGSHEEAIGRCEQALALFSEIGDKPGEAEARNGLGEAFLAVGKIDEAQTQHMTALTMAGQIGEKAEQARAHDGLAQSHQAMGNSRQAREHWLEALALYEDLKVPQADQVRERLAAAQP